MCVYVCMYVCVCVCKHGKTPSRLSIPFLFFETPPPSLSPRLTWRAHPKTLIQRRAILLISFFLFLSFLFFHGRRDWT